MKIDRPGFFSRSKLGDASTAHYREQGFLVVADALAAPEVDELVAETVRICRGERGCISAGTSHGGGKAREVTDEEKAALPDDEIIARYLCIHHAHKFSPLMRRTLAHPAIVEVLTKVIGPNVKCMQSMLFIKAAGKPGQAWHQDEDYIPTRDRSLAGAWIAMDDATIENGCLWVIPGSQKPGVLWPQYPHKDARFDCAYESYDFPYKDSDAVPVEVPRGAIVFFNGYLLHRSLPNVKKQGFRRALVNHYMSAESLLPWGHQPNVPVAKLDNREIVMIAGKDPYAYKGITDTVKPHVRPAGEGGCGDGREALATWKTRPAAERAVV